MPANGHALKQSALNLLEETRADYLARARRVAEALAAQRGEITIDDVRRACPPPEGMDGRVLGAVFSRRDWEATGFTTTQVATSHGRPIRTFRKRVTSDG